MVKVRPKKFLGQHFLHDEPTAERIVNSLLPVEAGLSVLEIGPGMGVLTKYLVHKVDDFWINELDRESVAYLKNHFPELEHKLIEGNFLRLKLEEYFTKPFAVIGNFPYNISSQILFKVLEYRHQVSLVVGMFQKEVAERVAEKPGSKTYGILSVLMQAFYDIEYLFTVNEGVFTPPPKVKSGVIRLKRNGVQQLDCDEKLFFQVVKIGFNQRRKTLRNALRPLFKEKTSDFPFSDKRAEQLSVEDFVTITQAVAKHNSKS